MTIGVGIPGGDIKGCPILFSGSVINIITKSNLGRQGLFQFTAYSCSWREVKAGTKAETTFYPWLLQPALLNTPGTPTQQWARMSPHRLAYRSV